MPALSRSSFGQSGALPWLETKLDDTVAPGLRREVVVRWGDGVEFDAPPFSPAALTVAAAEAQFGWDGRIVAMVAPPAAADGIARAVLVVAHSAVNPAMIRPGVRGSPPPDLIAALEGASVINLAEQDRRWLIATGGFQSRRMHGRTLCRVTGPAGSAVGTSVRGVMAPRGGCATPWGTVLLAEDASRRNDMAYGWIIEFDPLEPLSVPAKRTALGRLAFGDAAAALTQDGRAVVYMTDRRQGGYLYRFVSAGAAGAEALDDGTLSVARIEGESLRWISLPDGTDLRNPVPYAARAGASGLEIPAGLTLDPRAPRLFLACRHGGDRGAGRVLEIVPAAADHGAETGVVLSLLNGRPVPSASDPNSRRAPQRFQPWPDRPETVHADERDRIFVGTDRDGQVGAYPDALYACGTGTDRGSAQALYGAPRGAGIGGAALTPDGRTLLAMVRRPGAETGARWDRPGTTWPELTPGMPPRSTLIALRREDGAIF